MSKSETGHAINVSNFETLITCCTGFGQDYNPSNTDITTAALTALHVKAKAALAALNQSEAAKNKAINDRRIAFKSLKPFSTRLVNALAAASVSKETLADARGINAKIQGERLTDKPKPGEDGKTPDTNSTSRQSFDSMIEHYEDYEALLTTEAKYKPNEADLQLTAISQMIVNLKALNTAAKTAANASGNAIIARDTILYAGETGLVDKAAEVKNYVKSVYGASSPQFKQVSKIAFKRIPD